ncbi:PAS domain S-box-containing protein [Pseudomonas hunanensis]|nr:PAS domain S-box-containing protein [Pseudomonas hunanensis]
MAMPNVSSTLQALATDEVDAVVGDLASSIWSLRQLKLDGLYVSGETPYRYQLAMAVPREQKMLVGILDKVMADMSSSEVSHIQQRWVGNVVDQRTFWRDVLLYGLPAVMVLMAILAVVIRINRRLSSEISRRIALEQELRSSEYHYRGLVESLSAVAWEADANDFSYSYVSPHAEDLLGYPTGEWLKPGFWRSILHPEDALWAQAYCDSETAAGRDHSLDYRVIRADGHTLWVRNIVSMIEHGHKSLMRGLMIDISETKHTEDALRLSEQKFASVFQQCPDILIIARHSDGCLLEVNEAFEELIGLSPAQVIGRTATELGLWGVAGTGPSLLERLHRGGIRNLEMTFRRNNGELFTGLTSAETFDLDGMPALVVAIRDISQLKETQQQLQTSEEKFAKAFHASPDGLLLSRQSDGLLLEVNEGFCRLTGYDISPTVDQTSLDLGIWVDLNERQRLVDQLQRDGFVRDFSCHIRRSDGQIRLCELSAPATADRWRRLYADHRPRYHRTPPDAGEAATGRHGVREHRRGRADNRHRPAHQRGQPRVQRNHRLQRDRSPRPDSATARLRPARQRLLRRHVAPVDRRRPLAGRDLQQTQERRTLPRLADHQRRAQPRTRDHPLRRRFRRHFQYQARPGQARLPSPPRPVDRPAQSRPVRKPPAGRAQLRPGIQPPGRGAVPRPRPLQAHQRQPRPPGGRPVAQGHRPAPQGAGA